MTTIGNILLWLGIGLALVATGLLFISAITKNGATGGLGRFLYTLFFGDIAVLSGLLLYSVISADYSLLYVQRYVANDLNLFYRISAFWAGQSGSLILWVLVLSLYGFIVCLKEKQDGVWAQATIALISAFFIVLTVESNPFRPAMAPASDGAGLNPFLRNLWMIFHPPAIYLGYAGSAVPFAYIIAAYINPARMDDFIKRARIWTLFTWAFLGLGIFLGGRWAYVVLGWGGYWGWDPVENASLIPWFFGTALVHSMVVGMTRKEGFRRWALLSSFLFFFMSLTGTFITRSGVIQSVHAFAFSRIAYYFYVFMILMLGYLILLLAILWRRIKSPEKTAGIFTRENLLSLANWVLFTLGFGILAMTLLPPLIKKTGLSPTTFDAAAAPFLILLLVLMALALIAPWAGVKPNLKKLLWVIGLSVASIPLWYLIGIRHPYGLLGAWAAGLLGWAAAWELVRSLRKAFLPTLGAHLSHLGIAVAALGIVGSKGEIRNEFTYEPGAKANISGINFEPGEAREYTEAGKHIVFEVPMAVSTGERIIGIMSLKSVLYTKWERMGYFPGVDIVPKPWGDIYAALYQDENGNWKILAARVPLIQLLWIGCWILFAGCIMPAFARRRRT
jgi:cytochrome c-type biogenesis protein CcmF